MWQSFLLLFVGSWQLLLEGDRGFSCLDVLGSWVFTADVLGSWVFTAWLKIPAGLELHFHQGNCWWVFLSNTGEVESRREAEQFVSVHKLLRPDATTALSFYEMW